MSLEITGLDGPLEANVQAYISAIDEADYATTLRFQSRLQESIAVALKALGYYRPTIRVLVNEPSPRSKAPHGAIRAKSNARRNDETILVEVVPGPPMRLQTVDVQILGSAVDDPDFLAAVAGSGLTKGSILDHGKYEDLKSKLRNLALAKGYFDGDFVKSALHVSPSLNQAFISLHYQSGIRYRYGETLISGSQIDDERVRSLIPYQAGDPYLASDIGLLNQRLSNTDWFSSVFVQPDMAFIGQGEALPMNVSVTPQSRFQVETGLGYSTDVGVRGTLKWKRPWVNDLGHSVDASLSLSAPEQTIVFGYQIPLEDVLNEYYRLQYGMKYEDSLDTESLEAGAAVERHWLLESGWHRVVYLRYVREEFVQGAQDDELQLLMPGFSFSRSKSSGGAMPMSGNKQSLSVEVSDEALLARARLLRLTGRTTWIGSQGSNHRGLARLSMSANFIEDIRDLPPSLRFFAGGDNNLRGYEYESISPTDETGSLIGAKYMATSSLEYQYRLTGNWWLATFVDSGDAWSDDLDLKTGAGAGVRWASPVGPIRLDFAWGFDATPGDEFRIHLALGPEL